MKFDNVIGPVVYTGVHGWEGEGSLYCKWEAGKEILRNYGRREGRDGA